MATIVINGKVQLTPENKPLANVTVELWDMAGDYGRVSSVVTNPAGEFSFSISDPISGLIENQTISTGYKVYKDGVLIVTKTINYNAGEVITVNVKLSEYDAANTNQKEITISGTVISALGVPADAVKINLYETGFRTKTLLNRTVTNISGQYNIILRDTEVNNTTVIGKRSIAVEAVGVDDNDVLATTGDIFVYDSTHHFDLTLREDYQSQSSYESISSIITQVIGYNDIASIVVDSEAKVNEIKYVAEATGKTEAEVVAIVNAHKFAGELSVDPLYFYALVHAEAEPKINDTVNPLMKLKETEIRDIIANAVEANVIPTQTPQDIDDFVTEAKVFQQRETKELVIEGEEYNINTLLNSFFATQGDVNSFLAKMNERDYTSPADFWADYEAAHGATKAEKAIKGFRVANITGYQPQITERIMDDLGTNGIEQLSKLKYDDWVTLVSSVCTANTKLCVPAIIRMDATNHNNTDVQEEYAKMLCAAFQNIYPMMYIVDELSGGDGALLIEDAGVRADVITFINNNPKFDLRLSNVFDINSNDHVVNGINNLDDVIDGLAPFQRVLRITAGDPEIVCAFIREGLNSASAIADLDRDFFLERYQEVIGNQEKAEGIYDRAVTISNLAQHYTAEVMVNGNKIAGDTVLPYMDFSSELGGSTVAQPDFTTMFGSQGFCTCDRCMSMYSPAAYLTDILAFMRRSGVSTPEYKAYTELLNRRPDLKHIDLTCKNTNTPMPYVDLVNELLERTIMINKSISGVPNSFQTSGTAAQLAAYPEHIYKDAGQYKDYTGYSIVYNNSATNTTDGILNNAVFPNNLPFNLALQESRSYLQYLGKSRYELMKLFRPYSSPAYSLSNEITDYAAIAEMLGLDKVSADIITQSYTSSFYSGTSNDHVFYGFPSATVSGFPDPANSGATLSGNWLNVLSDRLDVMLMQAGITYNEFLEILITDYNNRIHNTVSPAPHRDVNIVPKSSANADTCKLNELMLEFNADNNVTRQTFFNRLHRFIRLYRTGKYSIYQWDILLRSFNMTAIDSTSKPTTNGEYLDFELLGKAAALADRLKMDIELLVAWWSNLDTTLYINYDTDSRDKLPTVYARIFDNKGVINNAGDNIFANPATLSSHTYSGNTSRLAALCLIGEDELLSLLSVLSISLTSNISHTAVSRIYVLAQTAKGLGYSISTFISLLKLSGALSDVNNIMTNPPYTAGSPSQTYTYTHYLKVVQKIINTADAIQVSGLDIESLDFIVRNTDGQYFQQSADIKTFYTTLREAILKLPLYVDPASSAQSDVDIAQKSLNQLVNIIYQQFAKQFNIPTKWMQVMLDPNGVTTASTTSQSFSMKILKDTLFRDNGQSLNEVTASSAFFDKYRQVHKIVLLNSAIKINTEDFVYLYTAGLAGAAGPLGFNFSDIPVSVNLTTFEPVENTSPVGIFESLLRLCRLMEVRDMLNLKDGDISILLSIDYTTMPSGASVPKNNWINFFLKRTEWGQTLTDLVGDNTVNAPTNGASTNLLRTTFPAGFAPNSYANLSMILSIHKIVNITKRFGLSALSVQKSLRPDLLLADSQKILLAAKGKQSDENWQIVAKPLRDTIRAKQRKALTAYLLANPPANNKYLWRNENDLFAYLLIDVEMEPVMITSRLKQAINSIQLFIDRAMLNLEYAGGLMATPISAIRLAHNSPFVRQWKKWRKWYGIWEANRQVFLYPENWIEPSLRDDKTEFFREFETQLLQSEITKDSVEEAFRTYLHNLDEVSRLEPVGVCDTIDTVTQKHITHAFARTYGNPQQYYYRTLIDEAWSGWQKMEIDMKGNHIVPVVWNERLYVFWTTCIEKKIRANWGPNSNNPGGILYILNNTGGNNSQFFYNDPLSPSVEPDPNDPGARYYHQLEFTLNWSEYKDGKWQKQKVGKESIKVTLNPYINTTITDYLENPAKDIFKIIPFYRTLTDNFSTSFVEMIKSRVYLHPVVPAPLPWKNPTNPYELSINLMYPHNFTNANETTLFLLKRFHFRDQGAQPTVPILPNSGLGYLAPAGTLIKDMHFVQYQPWVSDGALYKDNTSVKSDNIYAYDVEKRVSTSFVKTRSSSEAILDRAPVEYGRYKVKAKSNFRYHPMENQFFYIDGPNTFFARAIGRPIGLWFASDVVAMDASDLGNVMAPARDITPFNEGSTVTHVFGGGGTVIAKANYSPFAFVGNSKGVNVGVLTSTSGTNGGTTVYVPNTPATPINRITPGKATYYFQTFYHPHIHNFLRAIYTGGVDELMKISRQEQNNTMAFGSTYSPTTLVYNNSVLDYLYPDNTVDLTYKGAYSIYNWEIFFHIPMLIAQSLSANQKFEEAQKWFHYVFDPTNNLSADDKTVINSKQRFWRFRKFYDTAIGTPQSVSSLLLDIYNRNADAVKQVQKMQEDPLNPYAIARMRTLAFMKNAVIKYLENLIAWGDSLFSRNTIESINEATQLYILAANILGERPQGIKKRTESAIYSFHELGNTIDEFGNARVAIENYIDYNAAITVPGVPRKPSSVSGMMFYFCTPENKELMKYWDIVADRLYKIRNSLNLKGQSQKLPLFEPPINPALLVKAAASGVDFGSVLDDISGANRPHYRFNYIVQKANEYCADVKALGGALLSALEKKDAEELSLLRSGLELKVLQSTLQMKQTQLKEAIANLDSITKTREVTMEKLQYYSSRVFQNEREREHINTLSQTISLQRTQAIMSAISSGMALIPQFHIQAFSAVGPSWGGQQLSTIFQAISTNIGFQVAMKNTSASIAATVGGYERRRDDWKFQAQSAVKELEQIDKQIISTQIRIELAQKDVDNQLLQIENNKFVDEYMRSKYTNKELYSWMITQISTTYFQAYQVAFKMAKNAVQCYKYELPFADQDPDQIVTLGYWDSLKKGLMAGERLQLDIRRLEAAYLEENQRELELTKHVSIATLDPDALLELKRTGKTDFTIPTWLYSLDYPGHYNRRIKSVSITIPCVAGPYTSIAAELSLGQSIIYGLTEPTLTVQEPTPVSFSTLGGSIATSSAQNDNGMFEFNFKDERYLPFEGKGAHSTWSLSLVQDAELRQFDYNSISDVIVHIKYTAYSDGVDGTKATNTIADIKARIKGTNSRNSALPRIFNLAHEFSSEWGAGFASKVDVNGNNIGHRVTIGLDHKHFPHFCQGKTVNFKKVTLYLVTNTTGQTKIFEVDMKLNNSATTPATVSLQSPNFIHAADTPSVSINEADTCTVSLTFYHNNAGTYSEVDIDDIKDCYAVVDYYLTN